jgi:hypothetical protein
MCKPDAATFSTLIIVFTSLGKVQEAINMLVRPGEGGEAQQAVLLATGRPTFCIANGAALQTGLRITRPCADNPSHHTTPLPRTVCRKLCCAAASTLSPPR